MVISGSCVSIFLFLTLATSLSYQLHLNKIPSNVWNIPLEKNEVCLLLNINSV